MDDQQLKYNLYTQSGEIKATYETAKKLRLVTEVDLEIKLYEKMYEHEKRLDKKLNLCTLVMFFCFVASSLTILLFFGRGA